MSSYSEKARQVITELIYERFLAFIKRYCKCLEAKSQNVMYFKIAPLLDELERRIVNGIEGSLSSDVKIKVLKKFLRKEIQLEINGKTYSRDEALNLISRVRSFLKWYETDCSLSSIISEINDCREFNIVNFIEKYIDVVESACRGKYPNLPLSELADYVAEGVKRALSEYLRIKNNA